MVEEAMAIVVLVHLDDGSAIGKGMLRRRECDWVSKFACWSSCGGTGGGRFDDHRRRDFARKSQGAGREAASGGSGGGEGWTEVGDCGVRYSDDHARSA